MANTDPTTTASLFVRALDRGAWSVAAALVSPAVPGDAMSAVGLQRVWLGVTTQIGALQTLEPGSVSFDGELRQADLTAHFQRAEVTLRVVIGGDERVVGFWVRPPGPPAYTPPSYVDVGRFTETELTVGATPTLPAIFTRPLDVERAPVVVLVHGSGPNDRDERLGTARPFRDLAEGLATRGIAVLRYDKRSFAHPRSLAGLPVTLDVETIDDALAALAVARTLPNVDADRVFLLGHSLGATFAPEIATRDGSVAGVVMVAPSARPIATVIAEQVEHLASIARSAGSSTADLDALSPQLEALAARRLPPDATVLGAPAWYWYDLDDRRPVERGTSLGAPLFALFAGSDYQVTSADMALWREALAGRDDAVIRSYPGLDHLFIAHEPTATPSTPSGHVDQRVIDDVAAWITDGRTNRSA